VATLAFSDDAKDDLHRLARKSTQTAFRLINRLQSWAQNTPPVPSGATRLNMSIASQYQCQCIVDHRDFTIVFVYPHGIRRKFMVVGVYLSGESKANSKEFYTDEDDIYEIDD